MKPSFLLAAWLVHASLLVLTSSLQNLEADMARMSEKMLSTLMKSFSKPLSRHKREPSAKSLIDDTGVYNVAIIQPVSRICYPAVKTLFVDISDTTYAICVAASTVVSPAEVTVSYYRDSSWFVIQRWFVENVVDVAAFSLQNYLYVLTADTDKSNLGSELVKIDLATNDLVTDHGIHGSHATSISVWKINNTGLLNLAIANSNGYENAADLSSKLFIYAWTGTYFDQYASLAAYDVKDIEPFHIYGTPYLAISNFRRGKNLPKVDSEIFRFDLDERKWLSYQKITTYGAVDCEFFSLGTSLGQEFFLAVANKGNGDSDAKSMIYKFVDDKFVPFQCLLTSRATSFATFSRDNLFILAVSNVVDAVHIYQYDGWRFVESGVQWTGGAMSDGVVNLAFHEVKRNLEKVLILSVANPRHAYYNSVFEISFVNENPLAEWHNQSTDWCLNMISKLESKDLQEDVGFKNVIFTDQPSVTINGDVIFENGFETNSLRTSKFRDIATEEIFDYNLLNKLESLQKRLTGIKDKLERLSRILEKSMKVDGNQTILSKLKFTDASFTCKDQSCRFQNINTEFLNGERIVDWNKRMVFTDEEQNINGTLFAREINASNMNVLGSVDGVQSENLVTKSGGHLITGHKIFNNLTSADDLDVSGMVDGVIISSDEILLSTGYQVIYGDKYFQNLNTTWLKANKVNEKDLSEFYRDLVLTGKSSKISGVKTFKDVTVDRLTMTPGSTINGLDLLELWEKALWTDGFQEVQAEISFADLVLEKNLDVIRGINGVSIPGPKIVDITEPTRFEAPQTFMNSTYIGSLAVLNSLNEIPVLSAADGSLQLDIFLKTGDQIVTGSKTFHTINLDADSDVKGYVDGIDLSDLQATVLRKDRSVVTDGTWVFDKLSIRGPLTVEGKISNADLKEVYGRALKLNDSAIPEIVFDADIQVEDFYSRNISNIDIENDLVLAKKHQIISGKKYFTEVVLENSLVLGLVNNINMSFLDETLLVIGDQHFKSKTFNRDLFINHLTVENTINNIPMNDIVSLQGGKVFGSRNLHNSTFSFIDVKNIELTGDVNGIDIKEMVGDTMTYNDPQEISGTKVLGTIHIVIDANFQTDDLNGINLSDLWEDAVFVDVEQQIDGNVIFEDDVIFDNIFFNGTIDGVSDREIKSWMLKDEPQVVEGSSLFSNGFKAKDLNLSKVNNIDLEYLESNIVKVNEASEIKGDVIFLKSITSEESVGVTGKVQGIKLSEEAVLKRESLYVSGEKTFSNDVIISGPLTVDGLINDINVNNACNNTSVKNDYINVTRLVIKGNVVIEEGTVDGSLAGVELSRLKDAAVKDDGSTIKFSGRKTFKNVTFEGPVTVKENFGSIDINELQQNYMSLSNDQEILYRIEFDDVQFKAGLNVTNLDTIDGKIKNISLRELNDRILKTSQTQNVMASYYIDEIHFESDVHVDGKVNGLKLPSGVMRHNQENFIQSPKIFQQPLVVLGNLQVENKKTIQGVDVSEWFEKAVLVKGKFEINGKKTFNELVLNDAKIEGLLDGLKISEESLLMVYGNQVIKGRKTVSGNVDIDGSLMVHGTINSVNINELVNKAVLRYRTSNITGLKYFKQPLTIASLEAPTVSGIDVEQLKRKLDANFSTSDLEDSLEEIEGVVAHMKEPFNDRAVLFQYYELFQEFALPTIYDWLHLSGSDCGELLLLIDRSSSEEPCSSIRIFGFDTASNSFIPAQQDLMASNAVSIKSLTLSSTFLFVANKNPNHLCSGNSSLGRTTIDIYSWHIHTFKKVLSLEVNQVMDIAVFKDGTEACLVVLDVGTKVYCSEDYEKWTLNEILKAKGGQKVSVLQSVRPIMAIISDDTSYMRREGERYVDVYFWDSTKKQFSFHQQISSTFTQSAVLANHEGPSEEVFLILAEGSIPRIHNKPKILIYRYDADTEMFQRYQVIEDNGIVEWILLRTGEILFFVVDSPQGQINVYQHKGISGFVKIDTIMSFGVSTIHPFTRPDPEDWVNHYLALTGHHTSLAYSTQGEFFAKILKSKMQGWHPTF